MGEASGRGGASKWYAVHVAQGREQATADRCRKLVDPALLEDCFVPRYERYQKRGGAWVLETDVLFREYFIVATRDVRALDKALSRLSLRAELAPAGASGGAASGRGAGRAGTQAGGFASLDAREQEWLQSTLDDAHVLRASEGRIEGGTLRVERGPLRGREAQIRKIDRHKRMAYVDVGANAAAAGTASGGSAPGGGFTLRAALNVPHKD